MKEKISNFLKKDINDSLKKHKVIVASIVVIFLLACVGLIASYAYYQIVSDNPIIGGTVDEIPDLGLRIYVQDRTTNRYIEYDYIPMFGYTYNSNKSYCVNGSTITYNTNTKNVSIDAESHELCYVYFDATNAVLDLKLNVFLENKGNNGNGNGTYTKLVSSEIPSIGYTLNSTTSNCEGNATVSYLASENRILVESESGQDECTVYMDVLNTDIDLLVKLQNGVGSSEYVESNTIPSDKYYELNSSSACTGSSTISLVNQKVVVNASANSACIALLDISSGPIIDTVEDTNVTSSSITLDVTMATNSTAASKFYYSIDDGNTYNEVNNSTISITSLTSNHKYDILVYAKDANDKTSAIKSISVTTE